MKDIGIVRKIDREGRIVVPKESRKVLGFDVGQEVEMYVENNKLIVSLYKDENNALIKRAQEIFTELDETGYLLNKIIVLVDKNNKVVASNSIEIGKVIDEIKTSPHPFGDKNIILTSTVPVEDYILNIYENIATNTSGTTRPFVELIARLISKK